MAAIHVNCSNTLRLKNDSSDVVLLIIDRCFLLLTQGLYIEGARWNRELCCLDEATAGEFCERMPVMLLRPCQKSNKHEGIVFEAPVYQTAERKIANADWSLCYFGLKSQKPAEHWMVRGAALLCEACE